MTESIQLGDILISVCRKEVKHSHLSVYPPDGRVTLVIPTDTRLEVAHAFAATKLGWIRNQQDKFRAQSRETPRQYVERESHYIWGRRYLLTVQEAVEKPSVHLTHRGIILTVRPGTSSEKRAKIMHEWSKSLLHGVVPGYITSWEPRLGVSVSAYFLQRMKTKWGSCNPKAGNIRLNTELVKKHKDLLEYVIVHEMIHLIEPTHSPQFESLLDKYYPSWRDARVELNELPLGAEAWGSESMDQSFL